ncbi:MAG: glycosyltransferase family 4 protein [Gammaproteobacteria bacterium]|nr:glycosyltransferase family 4 protein [Gammaproteobacteria bacterium]
MSLLLLISLLFVGSALLTGLFRLVAQRVRLIDVPVFRSAHSNPVPVGGGLSIVVLVLLFAGYGYSAGIIPGNEFAALMAGLLIACIGIVDDVKQLDVRWRIPAQFLASIYVVYCLGDVPAIDFGLFLFPESLLLNVFGVFALVWLLNLFNFMDGIDGIAATELIAVNLLSIVIVINTDELITLLSASLAAAAGGFLLWNWSPAKIFMGDVGSSFIGFSLGVMALLSMHHGSMTVWTWVLLVGVFIVDATLTLFNRFRRKQRWLEGHASHAYQNAARHYKSHAKVTITVLLINLFWLGPLAWLSMQYPEMGLFIAILGLLPLVLLARRFGAGVEQFTL